MPSFGNTNFDRIFFLVHMSLHNRNYRTIASTCFVLLYCCLGMLMTSCFWGAKPILGLKRITLPEPLFLIRSVSDVLRAQSRFVKFVGGEALGRNRPYNEFITPTTFIYQIIGIFNGFPLPIFDVGYTLDSKYAVT